MKANTLKQLRFLKSLSNADIEKVMNKATYYNIVNGTTKPNKATIDKICLLFEIDEKEFKRLLKNTLKPKK